MLIIVDKIPSRGEIREMRRKIRKHAGEIITRPGADKE
jgi:hypothetical protein